MAPPAATRPGEALHQAVHRGREIPKADGFLVNTFAALEPVVLAALRDSKVVPGFPPVYAIGPLKSLHITTSSTDNDKTPETWLDEQPPKPVVYVAFGNRSAVSPDQLREIAVGLESSGCRFQWVVKTTTVDRDDVAELADVLGDGFLDRVQGRGLVTKAWVDQEALSEHPTVGVFLSHSGWNSVMEAVTSGVPLLAWPRGGDQRVNATALVSGGVEGWMEHWSWDGEGDWGEGEGGYGRQGGSGQGARVGEEAAKAVAEGGTSYQSLHEFIGKLKRA